MSEIKQRVLRDPIYGYIDLSEQEAKVIDSLPFQRLRRIKQLAHTYLVYPSANHTRFEHSLGAMHVAGLMATRLGLPPKRIRQVRLAALLHDIGHGPFSHLFEEICQSACKKRLDHEQIGSAIILSSGELRNALGEDRSRVLRILEGNAGIDSKIISGGLDCDKLDYFRRDSFHAGVRYGEYDFDRILRTMKPKGPHIYIPRKGVDAVEGFLLAREQLYLQVYFHHTRVVADEMLKRVAELGSGHGLKPAWFMFDKARPDEFLERFLEWNDANFESFLSQSVTGHAKRLLNDLLARRLLKCGYDKDMEQMPAIPKGRLITPGNGDLAKLERQISKFTGVPRYLIFAKVVKISMKQYSRRQGEGEELLAEDEAGEIRNFPDISKVKGPTNDVLKLFVFGPGECRDMIAKTTMRFIKGLEN